ncbi:ABC transporter transmembrane domain-containing protein [Helcococcus kunzii]|uniref:ABC transporter transmembrane domain-containing protein n=1 Tax=Helcococcus kunzii TaxID=40091 RepID=UPI0024AE1119|nr:ABC transporter ATP-binding protein [Helcococcus kunzii]
MIKNYLKNNKNLIFRIIAFTFLSTIFISLIPICTKLVIDNYSNLNVSNAIFYSLFYISSILLFLFFEYKKKVSIAKFGYNYSVNIKYEIFNSITRMSQKNINTKSNGDIINAITNDAEIVYENYIYSYISLIISGISLLVYLTYMFYLNWILSIVIIISAIISFFIPKLVGKNMSTKRKEFSDKTATLIHNLENLLEGRELFNYCTSDSFSRKFQNYNEINERSGFELLKYISFTDIFSGASLYFINIAAFISGIFLVYLDMIKLSELIATIGFVDLVAVPIRDIIYLLITINSSSEIINKLDFYLNYRDDDIVNNIEDFTIIELKDLKYKINNFEINDINTSFIKNKKYAIIGKNGSGKSTIMKLLAKKYIPNDGQIFIDDKDINDLNTSKLILYLSTLFLINDSIFENIKISNPTKAPGKEILDIVTNIYNKDVNSLSMGEKARVNIARALNTYHNVIILDEFFANIDTKSEYDLTKLLLKTNKTIILVTHNTDNEYLKLFDEVIEINNYI